MLDGATALTFLLPGSPGGAQELTSTDMPVLSEDSGECDPWLGCHSPEGQEPAQQPEAGQKAGGPSPGSRERPYLRTLGTRAWGENMSIRQGPLRVPWGPQEVPIALALLCVSSTLLRFARNPGTVDFSAQT